MAWIMVQTLDKEYLEGSGVWFFFSDLFSLPYCYMSCTGLYIGKTPTTFKFSKGTIIQKCNNTWKREWMKVKGKVKNDANDMMQNSSGKCYPIDSQEL